MSLSILINILIVLVILGIIWWIVQTYVFPVVAEPFRTIIVVVIALFVILYLLSMIGVLPSFHALSIK